MFDGSVQAPLKSSAFVLHSGSSFYFPFFSQVLEVIAAARNEDINELADTIFENTEKVFG